jgi:TRAP-type transport system small permease protein
VLNKFLDGYTRLLCHTIVALLAVMVVLVFGNVFLRYLFNSGIIVSEELSRWMFVWLTFFGALVGIRERAHLGSDFLVSRLGPTGKRICLTITYCLMFVICAMILKGSWVQTQINWTSTSPVLEASLAWVSGIGVLFAISAIIYLLAEIWQLITGQTTVAALSEIRESEETVHGVAP